MSENWRLTDLWRRPSLQETLQRSLTDAELCLENATQMREYYTAVERMLKERIERLKKSM